MAEDSARRVAAAFPDMCARLAAGDLIKDILAVHKLTRRELSAHILSAPDMRRQWDEAREASADALYDEAMQVARSPVDKDLAQSARLHVDTLKWAARIRNPKLYGDKAQLDVNVRTVDLTRIIDAANARLAAHQGRVIDVTPSNPRALSDLAHAQSADLVRDLLPPELAALM